MVSPGEFIPVAEETGLIIPLERWVLKNASQQLSLWQRLSSRSDLAMSINFSAAQYRQPDVVEVLVRALKESGLDPRTLRLEITESALLTDSDTSTSLLSKIQELDIQLHMDDFGTGYSSLSYLQRFPISVLKIDRSFVGNMDRNPQARQIVEATVRLGQSLSIGVTAEGIETLEQLRALQLLECDNGQGFLFSKPLDSQEATDLLAENHSWNLIPEGKEAASLTPPATLRPF
jgi:EAL domain-containing protein (putative c-di-GMP-specific phosphodiesterase class I)